MSWFEGISYLVVAGILFLGFRGAVRRDAMKPRK